MYLTAGKKRLLDIENYRQEVVKKIQALHYDQSSWSQDRLLFLYIFLLTGNYQDTVVAFFDWRNFRMNDKNFIEELRQKRATQINKRFYYLWC